MKDLWRSSHEGREALAHSLSTFPKRHPWLLSGIGAGLLVFLLIASGIQIQGLREEIHVLKREVRIHRIPCRKGGDAPQTPKLPSAPQ